MHQYNESIAEVLIDNAGILAPGLYEIHMVAEATVDPSFLGGSTGAEFGATLLWASYCPADFNGDGSADFFDYDDFVMCYEGVSCPSAEDADFNNDGSIDFFDYDDFILAFEAGC